MEPTATNANGDKIVYRGGQWVPMDSAPAPQTSAPQFPGVVQGRPKQPDPMEVERLRLAQETAARAERADNRQQQSFEGTGGQGTEAQNKASVLLGRISGGFADIQDIISSYPEAERPGLGETLTYGALGPESIIARQGTDWQRRAINDVQRDVVDALLTLGTGAAYNEEQLEAMRVSYFPQFGDTKQEIQFKQRRLQRMIETARLQAGPNAQRLDEAMAPFLESLTTPAEPKKATQQDAAPLGYETGFDRMGRDEVFDRNAYLQERFGIDPGEETRLVGMLNANRGNPDLTMDMLRRIYSDAGVTPPDEAGMQTLLKDMQAGSSPATGIDTSAAEKQYVGGLDTIIDRAGFDPESMSETAATSGRQGASFEGFDELVGVGNAIAEGLQGNNPIDGYVLGRDVTRRMDQRGMEANPVTSIGARVAGAIPTGGLAAGRVTTAGQAARVGAAESAIAGFGAGDGFVNSTGNALIAAPVGAVAGATVQKGGNALGAAVRNRRTNALAPEAAEVAQAGERMNVTVRRADVDPTVRDARAQVGQTPEGRTAIQAANDSDLAEIETSLVSNLGGNTTGRTQGGDTIQSGVRSARNNLRSRATRDYKIAAGQAGDIQVDPKKALDIIDAQIEELAANGANRNAKRIQYLRDTREDITRRGGLTVDGLRAMRTDLRSDLDNAGVYTNDFERRMNAVIDGVSEDIAGVLQRQSPEAAEAYGRADALWRQQAKLGEDVGDLLLGKRDDLSAGQAANRVLGWAKQDPRRLSRLLEEVDPDTRDEVRALVAGQLGRQSNGNFQLGAFLRETGEGSGAKVSPATLRALFGEDGAKAIKDLRALAQAKTDAAAGTNYSNTGSLVSRARGSMRRMLLAGFGFSAAGDAGTGVGALAGAGAMLGGEIAEKLGTQRTIRLVLNPDFARWLRQTPDNANPNSINRHFERLRRVATRTPGMMADVSALERAMVGAVNDNAAAGTRLAAEDQNAEER